MAQAKGKDAWAQTSAILAMLANANRDPKKTKPFSPSDFNPWTAKAKPKPTSTAPTVTISTSVLTRILLETPQDKE